MARKGGLVAGGAKNECTVAAIEKNAEYGKRRASGPLSSEGRVKGGAPHPLLKGHGGGSEALSVNFCRCTKWYVYQNIL